MDINVATLSQLQSINGIDEKLARAILDSRPINCVGDLNDVPGMNTTVLYRILQLKLLAPPRHVSDIPFAISPSPKPQQAPSTLSSRETKTSLQSASIRIASWTLDGFSKDTNTEFLTAIVRSCFTYHVAYY
jgi:hypothetical protein